MPGDIDPTKVAAEVADELVNSKPVMNLLGPVTEQIGSLLGSVGDIARFYAEDCLKSIFTKWADRRGNVPITPEEFRRVLPMLRDASMQSDDEMQDRWASLLEKVANDRSGVLPSFSQTLAQLTPMEARYLDRVWKTVSAPKDYPTFKRKGRDAMSLHTLQELYDPELDPPSPAEMQVSEDRMTLEQIEAYDAYTDFELMVHDLERLRILEKDVQWGMGPSRYAEIAGKEIEIGSSEIGRQTTYALTQYGVNFIQAVQPKI